MSCKKRYDCDFGIRDAAVARNLKKLKSERGRETEERERETGKRERKEGDGKEAQKMSVILNQKISTTKEEGVTYFSRNH